MLSLCKPPLCFTPRIHHHPPGRTSQVPGSHSSLCCPSPATSNWSASHVDLTLQPAFSNSIVIVLLGDRGSSSSLSVFLRGHSFTRAFLAFGHVSLEIFLHWLPARSIQRAALTFSFPCLSSIKPSQWPEVVVLKVWSLVSSAQNYSHHCLISELCYNGYISISASVTCYFNYVFVCLRC